MKLKRNIVKGNEERRGSIPSLSLCMKDQIMKIRLFLICLLILVASTCYAEQPYLFLFDRDLTANTGAVTIATSYRLINKPVKHSNLPVLLKFATSYTAATYLVTFGHEYFGHGECYRKLDVRFHMQISSDGGLITIYDKKLLEPLATQAFIRINGIRFERFVCDDVRETQIMHGFSYPQSILAFKLVKNKAYALAHAEAHQNDYYDYSKVLQAINPHTSLTLDEIKQYASFSFCDPFLLANLWCLLSSTLDPDTVHSIDALPYTDFNLYPQAATRTLGLITRTAQKLIRVELENGKTVRNKKIYGVLLKCSHIYKAANISIGGQIHHCPPVASSVSALIKYKVISVKIKYNFERLPLQKPLEVAGGLNFVF